MNFATLDLETNGFKGTSVLSASSIVFDETGRIVDFFNRFYYPLEEISIQAATIHGLTPERIRWLRATENYPLFFLEDTDSLKDFWEVNEAQRIIVHNISFDTSFLPASSRKGRKWWCSMKGLTDFCRIPGRRGKNKWPKLEEAEKIVRKKLTPPMATVGAETQMPVKIPHSSLSDCFNLYSIFTRVLANEPEWISFYSIRTPYQAPLYRNIGEKETDNNTSPDAFVQELIWYGLSLSKICGHPSKFEQMSLAWEKLGIS